MSKLKSSTTLEPHSNRSILQTRRLLESRKYGSREDILFISLQNLPLNVLCWELRDQLLCELLDASKDTRIRIIVLAHSGFFGACKTQPAFSAGADLKEMNLSSQDGWRYPQLPVLTDYIENSNLTFVAVIDGVCLGGGLELAISCDYRIITSDAATFAFPEVRIGLIPGSGGTQRFPRLVGVLHAVDVICTGRVVTSDEALKMGFLDAVCIPRSEVSCLDTVMEYLVTNLLTKPTSLRKTGALTGKLGNATDNEELFTTIPQGSAFLRLRNRKAPLVALEAIKTCCTIAQNNLPLGLKKEAELFRSCLNSAQSRALLHLFWSEQKAKQTIPRTDVRARFHRIGVFGGGFMGTGIACALLQARLSVFVFEPSHDQCQSLDVQIKKQLKESGKSNKKHQNDPINLQIVPLYECGNTSSAWSPKAIQLIAECDLIIEAIPENLALKVNLFQRLVLYAKSSCIFATNTSSIRIDHIAEGVRSKEAVTSSANCASRRFLGLHFFSPVIKMRLVEVVQGSLTCKEAIDLACNFTALLGKIPIVVKDCGPGFLVNRLLFPSTEQAYFMLEEGALPDEIDSAVREFGFPMGPFETQDLVGLDVAKDIIAGTTSTRSSARDSTYFIQRLHAMGRFGIKSGRGWYTYQKGTKPSLDDDIRNVITLRSQEIGLQRRAIPQKEIQERYVYTMINEAMSCLEDSVCSKKEWIDLASVLGFGFPDVHGGLLFFAENVVTFNTVVHRLNVYKKQTGTIPSISSLLLSMIAEKSLST